MFSVQQYTGLVQENNSPIMASRKFSYHEGMRYRFLLKLFSGSVKVSDMKQEYGNYFWLCLCGELLSLFMTRSAILRDDKIILTPRGRYRCLVLMRTLFSIVGDFRQMHTPEDEDYLPQVQKSAVLENENILVDTSLSEKHRIYPKQDSDIKQVVTTSQGTTEAQAAGPYDAYK